MSYHRSLSLRDFTVFHEADFEFAPGINAIIGANGTGKTHLLKMLYTTEYTAWQGEDKLSEATLKIFQIDNLTQLVRQGKSDAVAEISGGWEDFGYQFFLQHYEQPGSFPGLYDWFIGGEKWLDRLRPVFIPAIDMMGHTRRFLSTYDEYRIDFDQTHRDIVALLLAPERRTGNSADDSPANVLRELLGGEVEEESERFYLKTPNGRQPMPLVAEGLRKLATLYQLMKNGFLRPGSVLFWDEPEVNLSPIVMDELIGVLLALARSGVQIFLATHSYVILKELDLQVQAGDSVRFFALESTPDGTRVETADNYTELEVNPIAAQFDSIYDRELTRATGRKRKPDA